MNFGKENENKKQSDRDQFNKLTDQSIKKTKQIKREISLEQNVHENVEVNNDNQYPIRIQNNQNTKQISLANNNNLSFQEKNCEINETLKDLNQLTEQQYCLLNDKSTNQYFLSKDYIENPQEQDKRQMNDFLNSQKKIRKKQMNFKDLLCKLPVFNQPNRFILLWDFTLNFFVIIVLFFIPISFIYEKPLQSYLTYELRIIIPLMLILDMFVNINTSYYEKGKEQKNRQKILKDYFTNNFHSDIFPVIIYFSVGYIESTNLAVRIILLLFFTKIIQIWRIFKNIKESSFLTKPVATIMQLVELFCFILSIAHVLASIWLFIGLNSHSFSGTSWIIESDMETSSWQTQYISSHYFIMVTMVTVGYGDISATNNMEMIFAIGIIMISCGVFDYTLSQVCKNYKYLDFFMIKISFFNLFFFSLFYLKLHFNL